MDKLLVLDVSDDDGGEDVETWAGWREDSVGNADNGTAPEKPIVLGNGATSSSS